MRWDCFFVTLGENVGMSDSDLAINDDLLEESTPLCICCLHEIPHDRVLFCPDCGAPVDPLAAYMPFERVWAEGYIWREAVWRPRNGLTLSGVILFAGMHSCGLLLALWAGLGTSPMELLSLLLLFIPFPLMLVISIRSYLSFKKESSSSRPGD
jgi:hypothetical protein